MAIALWRPERPSIRRSAICKLCRGESDWFWLVLGESDWLWLGLSEPDWLWLNADVAANARTDAVIRLV
ncbi:MAG: hypothetical protein EA377_00765 [Phycisphaerales bacterium]|nr:MAG: hypothetical protein EA377_00765 [Phycisphaerales bacterium]